MKALFTLGLERPRLVLSGMLLLALAGVLLVVFGPLEVSTSRRGLVSLQSPHQARLFRYYEAFGRSEVAALVVTGGSAPERQAYVDRFEAELAKHPQFRDRVLGKLALDSLAETLFVWRPELLEQVGALGTLGSGDSRADPWVTWARTAERRITDELDGSAPALANSAVVPSDDARSKQQLNGALGMLRALRRALETDGRLGIAKLGLGHAASRLDADGYLTAGKAAHLVLIFPKLESDEGWVLAPVVHEIRRARDRALAHPSAKALSADLTGAPALAVDELASIEASSISTAVLSAGGILLLLLWVFRSFRHAAITIVPLLVGIAITLGFVELWYDGLNLVTSSFMSVLMGLGIDFGVHIVLRYKEERGSGSAVHPALRGALLATGPAIVAGGVTTLFAFLTTTVTEFAAFRALGVITAVGLLVMLACAFLLVPALVPLLAGERSLSLREMPGITRLANWVGRRARWVLVGSALATLLALASLTTGLPGFNGRYFDFLPKETESYRALQVIQQAGTPPAEAHFVVSSYERARALTDALRNQERYQREVSFVQSPSDLLPPETPDRIHRLQQAVARSPSSSPALPRLSPDHAALRLEAFSDLRDAFDELAHALRQANRDAEPTSSIARELGSLIRWLKAQPDQGTAALNQVTERLSDVLSRARATAQNIAARGAYSPEDLPPVFKARLVSKDGQRLAVHVYPSGDVWEPEFADRFAASLRALDPEVAGTALNVVPHERYITEGFQRAALISLLGVALIVGLTFRRWRDTLLALLPVTLGWLWMLGLMRPLGIEFTPANMVALPLILGLGVDTGVHILHRANEGSREATHLASLLRGTGLSVTVAALTSIIGFGALTAADYRAMQGLGLLLSLGVGLCLLASVVVLPAILVLLGRLR